MQPPAAMCPVCQTPYTPQTTTCETCGLIFASYAPLAIAPAAHVSHVPAAAIPPRCPHCAKPTRVGARVCGACGGALVFTYMPLQPGQSLANGRYTIQRAISRGGMGAIYLAADHQTFDRSVVVKGMLDYFDPANPEEVQAARTRFLQEAQTLATLRHPAIPQIFGYFQDGPHNYIVMEYVDGPDLDQALTRSDDATGARVSGRPYDHEDVLRWGAAICRVLEYLASRQPHPVIHHDIKPANLLIDRNSDSIRLVDFGTARARLLVPIGGGSVGLQQSSVFGTQGYAAPEQYSGQSEPRSDVYALAATLYHLATDDDPRSHPFSFPQLAQLGLLGYILKDAIQPHPAQRPTAGELRQRLEAAILPATVPALQAPDGTPIYDEAALLRWCEADWQQTQLWLQYGALPDQIERRWGKTRLAQQLRELKRLSGDWNNMVDRSLALLDPRGFGQAQPRLIVDPPTLDFGTLRSQDGGDAALAITNTGRRYVSATIELPAWVRVEKPAIALAPGQQIVVTFHAKMRGIWVGGRVRGHMRLHNGTHTLLSVPIRASGSFWRSLLRRAPRGAP